MEDFDIIECTSTKSLCWDNSNQIFNKLNLNVFLINIENQINYLDEFYSVISEDEKIQSQKYKIKRDSQRYILSKGIRRKILSKYLKIEPHHLSFSYNQFKKPYVNSIENLYFSISNSDNFIAMAFHNSEIGLDIEILNDTFVFEEIQQEIFSEAEKDSLKESIGRVEQFYTLWTRKEAIVKATSQGIDDKYLHVPGLTGIHQLPKSTLYKSGHYFVQTTKIREKIILSIALPLNGNLKPTEINLYNWTNILTN